MSQAHGSSIADNQFNAHKPGYIRQSEGVEGQNVGMNLLKNHSSFLM